MPSGTRRPAATATAPARRGPGWFGRVLIVLMWAGTCLVPLPFSVPWIQLAAGAVGTPGTLTVESCVALGRGRYDCEGVFVPRGGGGPVQVSAPADLEAGDRVTAQLTPEGDRAALAGARGVLSTLILPFFCLGGLGFLPYVLLYWTSWATRRQLRVAAITGGVLTVVSLTGIVVGLVAVYSV
ncbi:hypothetical protein HII36_20080 [Nonomuraea sp. NN258]|nr:hypothetical protein [Nonomuraea antri]